MFYVCNSNKCPPKYTTIAFMLIHLHWGGILPDSGGMVYAVKMYSLRQLQCTLSDIHTI